MAKLPKPTNALVSVTKIVLETLIEGLGVEAAVAAATVAVPFLATPVIREIFRWAVEQVAQAIDDNAFKFAAKLIIRMQSSSRKKEFNESMIPIMGDSPSEEEIKRAREAADRLIERGRR